MMLWACAFEKPIEYTVSFCLPSSAVQSSTRNLTTFESPDTNMSLRAIITDVPSPVIRINCNWFDQNGRTENFYIW